MSVLPAEPCRGLGSTAGRAVESKHVRALSWDEARWFGLRIGVPSGWGCVRHSCRGRNGRLVFADRTRPRLQVAWSDVEGNIGVASVLDEYRRRTLDALSDRAAQQDGESTPAPDVRLGDAVSNRGWSWVTRYDGGDPTLTRLLRIGPDRRLVELTLVHGPPYGTPTPDELAERCTIDAPSQDATRWRLLGIDVEAPPGWSPTRVDAKPADVELVLSHAELPGRPSVSVRRRGLTPAWFDGDLPRWLRAQHPDRRATAVKPERGDFTHAVIGRAEQPRWRRWLGQGRTVTLLGRHDVGAERIVTVRVEGRPATVDFERWRFGVDGPPERSC